MTVPTSFFEAVKGNPNLAPVKVLGNTLSYNGQIGKSEIMNVTDNCLCLFSQSRLTDAVCITLAMNRR